MTVTAVDKDPDTLTLRITSEFAATPERIWQLWADPRQLERWWGPPTWPATFTSHELDAGRPQRVSHDRAQWRRGARLVAHREVERRAGLTFRDGFADPDGTPSSDLPDDGGDRDHRGHRRRDGPA